MPYVPFQNPDSQPAVTMLKVRSEGMPPICLSVFSHGKEIFRIEDSGDVYVRGEKIESNPHLADAVYSMFPTLKHVDGRIDDGSI